MIRRVNLNFKQQDFERANEVPFYNASQGVFGGLQVLLDEQTPADRRPAAVVRIREYAGLEPGYTALTEILKQRITEQMAKPGVIYPARVEIETEMARNSNYLEGIAALMQKYKLTGWEEPFAKLKTQLTDYDAWVRATVLPKARNDFRLPPQRYALDMENYGIDIPPAQLATMAHDAFIEIQGEMKSIALKIASERKLPSSDYRDVIRELKKQQLVGDAILPFYQNRLKQIEKIIVDQQIVTRFPTAPRAFASPPQPRPRSSRRRTWCLRHSCTTPDRRASSSCRSTFRPAPGKSRPTSTTTSPTMQPRGRSPRTRRVPDTNCNSTPCWSTASRSRAFATPSTAPTSKAGDCIRNISSSRTCRWKASWSRWS